MCSKLQSILEQKTQCYKAQPTSDVVNSDMGKFSRLRRKIHC